MSWLERRRPKKSHPWPPRERRDAVLWEAGKQDFRRYVRELEERVAAHVAVYRAGVSDEP